MKIKDIAPGYKTKITGYIMGAIPLAGAIGYKIDPIAVSAWLQSFYEFLAGGYVLLAAAVHFFRDMARNDSEGL